MYCHIFLHIIFKFILQSFFIFYTFKICKYIIIICKIMILFNNIFSKHKPSGIHTNIPNYKSFFVPLIIFTLWPTIFLKFFIIQKSNYISQIWSTRIHHFFNFIYFGIKINIYIMLYILKSRSIRKYLLMVLYFINFNSFNNILKILTKKITNMCEVS